MAPIASDLATKSTNVRVSIMAPEERPARAVALAIAIWAAAVALGAADDVFARLGTRVDFALAAFAALFAGCAYALDETVRRWIDEAPVGPIALLALAGDAALAAMLVTQAADAPFTDPGALVSLFVAPLALAAHLPLARAIAARRLRSAAARPPGARRAAT